MKKEIYICDKCKKEFKELYEFNNAIYKGQFNVFEFDLCKSCLRELKKWLKDEND